MERVNEMKEMMQSMMLMTSQDQMIKVKPFIGKQEDFPKLLLKQKQNIIMADIGHVLDKKSLAKLPSNEVVEIDESIPEQKEWGKCRQQNATVGAVILSV